MEILNDERICKCCNLNECEDEEHFITRCTLYESYKSKLYTEIKELFPSFDPIDNHCKFMFLMSVEDPCIINKLSSFIDMCFELRVEYNGRVS